MSNRPKLQKPRISNREMARDTKQLVESGVQMCEILAFIHEAATAPACGGPFKRYAQRKAALARIAAITIQWNTIRIIGDGFKMLGPRTSPPSGSAGSAS